MAWSSPNNPCYSSPLWLCSCSPLFLNISPTFLHLAITHLSTLSSLPEIFLQRSGLPTSPPLYSYSSLDTPVPFIFHHCADIIWLQGICLCRLWLGGHHVLSILVSPDLNVVLDTQQSHIRLLSCPSGHTSWDVSFDKQKIQPEPRYAYFHTQQKKVRRTAESSSEFWEGFFVVVVFFQ